MNRAYSNNPKDGTLRGKLGSSLRLQSSCITRLSKLGPRWDRKCVYSGAATDTETPCV